MKVPVLAALAGLLLPCAAAEPHQASTVLHSQPLHAGRIDPKLFGNFVELLDDVVPGMWSELLNDRSFEGIVPAANWSYFDGSPDICDRPWDPNSTWSYDPAHPFNGARSARLSAGPQPATLTQSGLAVLKGNTYAFTGYLRGDPGVKATVSLKFLLPSGEWINLASAPLPAISSEWQRVAVDLPCSGTTDRARFELRMEGPGQLWADKLSLMPKDSLQGWRPDVVAAIQQVRPAIIRWGGSSVDPGQYKWKEGIGDRDKRVPWRNKNWGRMDPNDVGVDEFCQFCELVEAEPLLCVSFADGPESAGELVEYCNGTEHTVWGARRAADGHPAPYRVKYWQIGNEISGHDPQYLSQFPAFIDQIKRADPHALIMTSFPSQKLLDTVGRDVAFVCPHHYTPDLNECDRDFNRLAQMIDHTAGCAHLKLGVTEWNIDAGSWGLGRAKQATLEAGLMNARYLHVLMRHSDKVEIACRSNLANSFCGAIIETAPSGVGVLKRASYHIMSLYSRHAKPIPLWIEQFNDQLDLFACATERRDQATLFTVNPKPEWTELSVQLDGFGARTQLAAAEAVHDTKDAQQPDVMNHWDAPERIRIDLVPIHGNAIRLPPYSVTAIEIESK